MEGRWKLWKEERENNGVQNESSGVGGSTRLKYVQTCGSLL